MKGKSPTEVQTEKIFKHTRQGSFGTRARYQDSAKQFITHVSEKFKLMNIRNVSDKHVADFVKARQEAGISAKTIKNDLSAIRYMHDQISNPRYALSDNKELQQKYEIKLEKTPAVNGDRSWTKNEYEKMVQIAKEYNNATVANTLTLARTMGLRVTEAAAISRSQAEYALKTGVYQVKGEAKNGKHRQVALSPEGRNIFQERLPVTPRGERLFIRPGEKTHQVVNKLEKFVENHRSKIITEEGQKQRLDLRDGSTRGLTYHGLRYSYVQERMEQEISKGYTHDQAALIVSKEVGHERIEVIKIYE